MNFADLQEHLRLELVRRIDSGLLTGTRLAQQTGFRQAHISNFLNRKRALSLEGLDRVLDSQRLTIDQILPLSLEAHAHPSLRQESPRTRPSAAVTHSSFFGSAAVQLEPVPRQQQTQTFSSGIPQRHGAPRNLIGVPPADAAPSFEPTHTAPVDDLVYSVPLVSPSVAMDHPRIAPAATLELLPISAARLFERNPRREPGRHLWQRFVAIRVDAQQAAAMAPILTTGAAAVIDRHSTTPIASARSTEPALFAVRSGASLLLRFVEIDTDHLILRPTAVSTPVQLIPLSPEQTPSNHLVGRVTLLLTAL